MINNPTKFLFFMSLMGGTLITISANSWFGAWMGLEINLLSFIPLMTSSSNLTTTEASLKYFLIQAIASATLLYSVIIGTILFNVNDSLYNPNLFLTTLINTTLLLKTGAAPFHFWFPGVMEGLNWMNGLILMTWQKIAPLMLLSYNITLNNFTIGVIVACMVIGSLGGLNQTSLRKILAYSSINHLGWMIAAITISDILWGLYFSMYVFLSTAIIFIMNTFKIYHLNQIFSLNYLNPQIKFTFFTTFLSLGGLPPFLGFLPKWMVIQTLSEMKCLFLISVMVVLTLITLFYYLRVTFSAFMLSYTESIWNMNYPLSNSTAITSGMLTMISTFGLLLTPLLYQLL
uniref:NADH-ubiquinone oxidoreductase chain 2 n=1 Tax=Leuctra nigra TaxID=143735 RepID=A0A7L7S2P5_9NEOP|nr:NADH dehydrogenase subunit 2 [Leuctra nigra]